MYKLSRYLKEVGQNRFVELGSATKKLRTSVAGLYWGISWFVLNKKQHVSLQTGKFVCFGNFSYIATAVYATVNEYNCPENHVKRKHNLKNFGT